MHLFTWPLNSLCSSLHTPFYLASQCIVFFTFFPCLSSVHYTIHFTHFFPLPLSSLYYSLHTLFSWSLSSLYCSLHTLFSWSLTGAIDPMKCPLGYKEYNGSPRATFEDTCEPCLPGSYGADPNRAVCNPCRAGVVCLAAATTDNPVSNGSSLASALGPNATNSYLCPAGESNFMRWWMARTALIYGLCLVRIALWVGRW